jgi:hypothetical protein
MLCLCAGGVSIIIAHQGLWHLAGMNRPDFTIAGQILSMGFGHFITQAWLACSKMAPWASWVYQITC